MNDNSNKGKSGSTPIIRKIKKNQHKHHGGSWKIAFADFVTAMMAFFLLMWLIASLNKAQKDGIAEYFKQPMKITFFGGENVGNQQINLKGGGPKVKDTNGQVSTTDHPSAPNKKAQDIQVIQSTENETQKLEELKSKINLSIKEDPSLAGLKNQLIMEVVNNGLRIQLIDNQNKPMFDVGSDKLNPGMDQIFTQIAKLLKNVPNKITIEGHTDAHPYHNPDELEYTNWELSAQRANAARRALVKAGLNPDRVVRVAGFSSTEPLNQQDPYSPENRRISIIVIKKGAETKTIMNK
ncbi:motility protein MotB [Legionella qingyii]|uniref:Motility protein MotB n=1 Tax=Legionella qingyii TaxID=2184757 RepID=A0A317U2G6_9GAMM|nr:flagellar motor protein MotB [Legionella qingyii]PWY54551.1 motility protein MotB [Legionella qingyii]PWY55549.1 motility protein MotB [Legionella qingyii]RUR21443.1 motility protein MotB [Legionella qingyii]RUR24738.1 motility protein MotB [Legionella qingyii]